MKHGFHILVLLFTATLVACGGSSTTPEKPAEAAADMRTEAVRRVRNMEDSLSAQPVFDKRSMMAIRDVYLAFSERFPLDTLAPDMLRKAASTTGNLGDHKRAISLYDRLIKDYPSWPHTPDVYYFRASEIETGLGQKGEAKRAYEEFISKFPENEFADDARMAIEYMQYTPEQLMEIFRKKNEVEAAAGK